MEGVTEKLLDLGDGITLVPSTFQTTINHVEEANEQIPQKVS